VGAISTVVLSSPRQSILRGLWPFVYGTGGREVDPTTHLNEEGLRASDTYAGEITVRIGLISQ